MVVAVATRASTTTTARGRARQARSVPGTACPGRGHGVLTTVLTTWPRRHRTAHAGHVGGRARHRPTRARPGSADSGHVAGLSGRWPRCVMRPGLTRSAGHSRCRVTENRVLTRFWPVTRLMPGHRRDHVLGSDARPPARSRCRGVQHRRGHRGHRVQNGLGDRPKSRQHRLDRAEHRTVSPARARARARSPASPPEPLVTTPRAPARDRLEHRFDGREPRARRSPTWSSRPGPVRRRRTLGSVRGPRHGQRQQGESEQRTGHDEHPEYQGVPDRCVIRLGSIHPSHPPFESGLHRQSAFGAQAITGLGVNRCFFLFLKEVSTTE